MVTHCTEFAQRNALFLIPIFVHVLSVAAARYVRGNWPEALTVDLPRIGPDLCKIAWALLLGTILRSSGQSTLLVTMALMVLVLIYMVSFACYLRVEGRVPWRDQITLSSWVLNYTGSVTCGLAPFVVTVYTLRGA